MSVQETSQAGVGDEVVASPGDTARTDQRPDRKEVVEADADGRVRGTQAHLAGMLGVQRSRVQRVLKQLEAAELVRLRYR